MSVVRRIGNGTGEIRRRRRIETRKLDLRISGYEILFT